MCLVLYIGSDLDCPLLEPQDFTLIDLDAPLWATKVTLFSVEELSDDESSVAKHFKTKIVRYAGSFEGCACGFNASYVPDWDGPVEGNDYFLAGKESRRLLRKYVEQHEVRQIYACWNGDESLGPESEREILPEQLTNPNFEFPERVMLRISSKQQKRSKSRMPVKLRRDY